MADQQTSRMPGPSLLNLPLEIRAEIYRLLLRQDDMISETWDARLHPVILHTCHQVLFEAARPLLYSENTWSILIFNKCGQENAYVLTASHFGEDLPYLYDLQGLRVKRIQGFEITVEIQDREDLEHSFDHTKGLPSPI